MAKPPKNQQSSIDRLPPDIREKLFDLLNDPRVTQLAATAEINAWLAKEQAALAKTRRTVSYK